MYNAADAREKSKQNLNNQFQKEKEFIEHKINEAIENGDFCCYLKKSISEEALNWLTSLGFKVEYRNLRDYIDTVVQW